VVAPGLCYFFQAVLWAGWLLAICFAYLSMFSQSDLRLRNYRYDVHNASVYAIFSPFTTSLALGWLIWVCYTDNGGKHEINLLAKIQTFVVSFMYHICTQEY
jgi:hypothetical protein